MSTVVLCSLLTELCACKFSCKPDVLVHLHLSTVRLTENTTFLAIVYVLV